MKARILVVDDDSAMCEVLVEGLGEHGYEVVALTRPDVATERIQTEDWDAVVADLNMPGRDGLSLCRESKALRPELPVILITAFGSMETAIGAIRAGAWDFVTKPLDPDDLALTVARAVEVRRLRRDVKALQSAVREAQHFGDLLGESPPMKEIFDLLSRIAGQDITILIQGETGTGKELVARAIHSRSPRAGKPFVAFNGAALPESLVEGELFGHARGAFTDARNARRGLLFEADGGSLFLDEVGEIPLTVQPKLLRALQERSARPLGGDRELPFDVRIIAATHRNLADDVDKGRFRADLFYRLNVVDLMIPPLRHRGNDVLFLAQHFLERSSARMNKSVRGLLPETASRLLNWRWPGNVRELQNTMERAVALSQNTEIQLADLPEAIRRATPEVLSDVVPEAFLSLEEVERRHILRVLEAVGGSKASAARILGLDRATLYRRLERYGER